MIFMRRPVCIAVFMYLFGCIIQYIFLTVINGNLFIPLIVCITTVLLLFNLKRKERIKYFILLLILLIGAYNFKIRYEYNGDFKKFFNADLYVTGTVLELSSKNQEMTQMTIKGEAVQLVNKKEYYQIHDKMIVKVKGKLENEKKFLGKRITIYGMLKEAGKRRNPKMFDYSIYLKSKKTYGILYAKHYHVHILEKGKISFIRQCANQLKYYVENIVFASLPEQQGSILLGIIFGDKDNLDPEIYHSFKKVGTAHVLAVSGLHVGIFYMFLNKIMRKFSDRLRLFAITLILFFYAMMTGGSPSVIRAILMIIVLMIAPMIDRRYDSLSALCAVALLLLLYNPLLIFHIGFQLSFGAVLSIILLYKPILERISFLPDFWAQSIGVIISAQLGTIPIIAYHFNFVSLAAFVANIPIVMIVGYVVPLGFLMILSACIAYPLTIFLGRIIFILLNVMMYLTDFISNMPMASFQTISPSLLFMLCYYFFLWIVASEKRLPETILLKKRKQICILILASYFCICSVSYLIPQKEKMIFVDVGQGDCTLIKTSKRKTILIDGGGSTYNINQQLDIDEDILVPFLLRNGINHIDMMILSHPHKDHIGGLLSVLSNLKVNAVFRGVGNYESEDLRIMEELCNINNINIYTLQQGDKIQVEKDMHIEIIFPEDHKMLIKEEEANNNSLVFLIEQKGVRTLFAGDIERETEIKLAEKYSNLKADILKVAHHGSNTSSTDEIIQLIQPRIAVIQVGKNHFGHPSSDVLNRFSQNNVKVFRNDEQGAIILQLKQNNIRIKTILHPDVQ